MKTPAEIYTPSPRRFEGLPELDYGGCATRKVQADGCIVYEQQRLFITTALAGWQVGLKPSSTGVIELWFSRLLLGHIDPKTFGFLAVPRDSKEAQSTLKKL